MWTIKIGRVVLSLAAIFFVLALTACGGGSSNSSSVTTPPPSFSGPRHVQTLLYFEPLPNAIPIPSSFISNVLPNISGVSISLPWISVDTTTANGSGSYSYTYDFSTYDAALQPYLNSGKMVNLIVWPATEGGNNDPSGGGSTPPYVLSAAYATFVKAPNPQDMTVCPSYPGDPTNPFYSLSSTQTGGGAWNVNTNSDISGLPVSYEIPFMTAYQNFIKAVIQHYNGNSSIGYIRFGFSQGGENSQECNQFWPGYSDSTYLAYIQNMTNFVKQQSPTMMILEDMHAKGPLNTVGASEYVLYPDTEAQDAVTDDFGFGTNGLQKSDAQSMASGTPCDSDWCATFSKYSGTTENGKPITLSLQTLQWTDPTNADPNNPTGSLAATGSFEGLTAIAQQGGANNLELYQADAALAFDATNYCQYPHSNCSSGVAAYSSADTSAYAAAIQAFLGSN